MKLGVVVDTNVVVSGLITSEAESPTARIVDAMVDGSLRFVVSPALLAEYWSVLKRRSVRKYHGLSDEELETILTAMIANAVVRDPPASADPAPDRGDQHLWDLLDGDSTLVLITGDEALLRDRGERSTISPAGWFALPRRG